MTLLILTRKTMATVATWALFFSFTINSAHSNYLQELPKEVDALKFNNDLFDVVDNMNDLDSNNIDLQEYIRKMFLLLWRAPVVDISEIHRYDSLDEKLISGGLAVNTSECNKMLKVLIEKIEPRQLNGSSLIEQGTDYRLFNMLDSFGRPEGSFLRGAINWLGDYDQCIKAKYDYQLVTQIGVSQMTSSRYCLAHVRWPKWKNTKGMNELTQLAVKSAVCLPETCDSLAAELEENKQMIGKLMDIHYGSAYKNYQLGHIYCLPDRKSHIIQFWHDLPATCCVIFFATWIFTIVVATGIDLFKSTRHPGTESHRSKQTYHLVELFSLIEHTRQLFAIHTLSDDDSIVKASAQKTKKISNGANDEKFTAKPSESTAATQPVIRNEVSLKYLHCVKVIVLFSLLKVHYIMLQTNLTRIYDLSRNYEKFDAYHLQFAAMAVNIFLMITGMLIANIMFGKFPPFPGQDQKKLTSMNDNNQQQSFELITSNKNNSRHFLLRPSVWIGFCSDRYLKIVPVLFLATLFPRYLYKYWDTGPNFFYGTSHNTNSYQCQKQSWLYLFLGILNWRPINYNCLGSEWYLAINLQCAVLVTPLAMIAYIKAPRITFYATLILPVVVLYLYLASDIYIPDSVRGMPRYNAHSFAFYAIFLHEQVLMYSAAFPRMIFFLIGVTIGYMLHIYTSPLSEHNAHLKFMRKIIYFLRKPILSNWFTWIIVLSIVHLPVSINSTLPKRFAMLADTNTTLIGIGITVFLYAYTVPALLVQLSTGSLGNSSIMQRCLNSSFWIPLSRMSLSVLLIDPLVNAWFRVRQDRTARLTLDVRISEMIGESVIIYFIAFIAYVSFESPCKTLLRIVQNRLLLRYFTGKQKSIGTEQHQDDESTSFTR